MRYSYEKREDGQYYVVMTIQRNGRDDYKIEMNFWQLANHYHVVRTLYETILDSIVNEQIKKVPVKVYKPKMAGY
jgi:uncharacterized protein (DUF111 family)